MRVISLAWTVMLVMVFASLTGCGRESSPGEQDALGAAVWQAQCHACHTRGGIGARLSRAGLASYGSAERLVDYVRLAMPYGLGGALTDDEYLAVVAYMLHEYGLLPDTVAVGHTAADSFSEK